MAGRMMKLTKLEAEILAHRLESGVLVEVYCESEIPEGESPEYQEAVAETVSDAEDALLALVRSGTLPDTLPADSVEAWLLEDCINGSTWVGCMAEETEQLTGRHYAIGCRLAEKVSKVVGRVCEFPSG
jgi:hypothetical protein